jgi:hypothetical protein
MFNDQEYMKGILGESVAIPPALRDYSSGTVAYVMRQVYTNMFPQVTDPDAWKEFYSTGGAGSPFYEEAMTKVRKFPLSKVPNFTKIQEEYSVDKLTYKGQPIQAAMPGDPTADDWAYKDTMTGLRRGEQMFKGITDVGGLQKFVVSSMYESIMQVGARRFQGNIMEGVGQAVTRIMESFSTYDPGVDVFNKATPAASSQNYFISAVFGELQNLFSRDKDPLGKPGINVNMSKLDLPSIAADESRLKPVPGQAGAYQLPGLFSRTGRPFDRDPGDPMSMLEKVRQVGGPGWKPITMTPQDTARMDTLFGHTYGAETGKRPSASMFNIIETYRDYLQPGIERHQVQTPVNYTMEFYGDEKLGPERARIYRDMPASNPTGYYFDRKGNVVTDAGKPIHGRWLGMARGIEWTRPNTPVTFDPMKVKFLMGHQSQQELEAFPNLAKITPQYRMLQAITSIAGGTPTDAGDPYTLQRRAARRIYVTQDMLTNQLNSPAVQADHATILEWEAEGAMRDPSKGMVYNPIDAGGQPGTSRTVVNALTRQIENLGTQIGLNVGSTGPVSDRWYLNALERRDALEARLAAEYSHYGVDKDARAIGRSHRYVSQQFADSTTRTAMMLAIEKKNMPAMRYPGSAIAPTPYMREQDAGVGGQLTLGSDFGIENRQYRGGGGPINIGGGLFSREFPQPAGDPTGRLGQGAGYIRVQDRFINVTPPPGEHRILPDGTEINKPGAPHTWVNDPIGTGSQRVAGIYPARKFGNVSPPSRNELDYLSRPSVNRLSMIDDRPPDEILTQAERWDIEKKDREARIAFIRDRGHIDASGTAMAATVARNSMHYSDLLPNIRGGKVANILYSAGLNFLDRVYNPRSKQTPVMPEDPLFNDREGAYTVNPVPQQTRNPQDNMTSRIQAKVSGVIDDVNRRLEIKYGVGKPFAARQLTPTAVPADVLPEEEAFAGSSSKGIAIGEYGYLRGEFMTQTELEAKFEGRELLQKGYLEGRTAASHEIGHVVLSKLPQEMQDKFSVLFNKMVNKLGQEKMLSADVQGKKFNFSEEFSAAYSIAATQGADALKEYYPEYADFFSDNWEEIEKAEDGTKVIRYKGDKNAKAFSPSRQLQKVHGELPVTYTSDYENTAEDRARIEKMRIRASVLSDASLADEITAPMRQANQTAQTFSRGTANVLLSDTLGRVDIESERIQAAASKAVGPGQIMTKGMTLTTTETESTPGTGGEILASSRDVQRAMGQGRQAVEMALAQGDLPASQREWAATLIDRTNKFIEKTYDVAIKQAAPGAQEHAQRTLANIGKKVAAEYVLGEVAPSKDFAARGDITGLAYGARTNISDEASLMNVAKADPRIRAMVETGQLTAASTRGPGQIIQGTTGAYKVGDVGPPASAMGGRLNLWGGRAGAAMYSSYIVKRMWQMTAAPALDASQEYTDYMGSFSGIQGVLQSSAGTALAQTAAGATVRAAASERVKQRGAYQQFGGFADMSAAFGGGSDASARLTAAGQAALGVGVAGAIIGQTAGFMGQMSFTGASTIGAIGANAVPIAAGVGLAIGAGALVMEAFNAWDPDVQSGAEEPRSYGYFGRQIGQEFIYAKAMGRAKGVLGFLSGSYGPGFSTEEGRQLALENMTDKERAIYEYQGELPETRRIREQLEGIEYTTGEGVDKMQGPVRQLATGLKGMPSGFIATAQSWNRAGITVQEGTNAFMNLAGQFGYKPGTIGFGEFWDTFNNTVQTQGIRGYQEMISRGGKIAQFGGQIASYYQSPSAALQLTDKYDLTTASRMMPVQSMLATASHGGIEADSIIGYNATRDFQGTPLANRAVTFDTAIAQLAERRGTATVAMIDQPVQAALQASGYAPALAPFAAEQMGFYNPQQAQAAGAWLGQANLYGQGFGAAAGTTIQPITTVSNFSAQIIPQIAEPLMRRGYGNVMESLAAGMGQNLTDQEQYELAQGMAGDLGMFSHLARQQIGGKQWTYRPSMPSLNLGRAVQNALGPQTLSGAVQRATSGLATGMQLERGGIFEDPYFFLSQDRFGQAIYQTDFGGALGFMSAQETAMGGMPPGYFSFAEAAGIAAGGDLQGAAMAAFGDIPGFTAENAQAWADGSLQGRTAQYRGRMRELRGQAASMAGAGAALSAQHLWGGGAWTGTPAEGSIWALQDQQRAMQRRHQMANFRYQGQMMQMNNEFAIRGEDIQGQRMEVSQGFNRWQSGFQFQGMQIQRGYAREDFAFNQQMRNMSFGWQMEDFDEAIRTSTGRQRAQLVRKRDRAATQFNLEGEQVDKQQERQEEMWAREDERFAKTQEYQETMMELDEETFELGKERRETMYEMESEHFKEQIENYKESYALQTEMIAKQRDYQAAQIALAGAQAAIQKEMQEATETYNEEVERMTESYGVSEKSLKNMVDLEPEKIFEQFTEVIVNMGNVTEGQLTNYKEVYTSMKDVNESVLTEMRNTFGALNNLSPIKIGAIAQELYRLSNAVDGW